MEFEIILSIVRYYQFTVRLFRNDLLVAITNASR